MVVLSSLGRKSLTPRYALLERRTTYIQYSLRPRVSLDSNFQWFEPPVGQETYRLLVQLNRGWHDEQGGMLMLFSSASPDDVRRIIRPLHGSAFAFRITPQSFHAVSTVRSGERFTLVYSFREAASQ